MDKIPHICKEDKTCLCWKYADAPNKECPIHGRNVWPPRCGICGKFMKWPAWYKNGYNGEPEKNQNEIQS